MVELLGLRAQRFDEPRVAVAVEARELGELVLGVNTGWLQKLNLSAEKALPEEGGELNGQQMGYEFKIEMTNKLK